MNKMSKEIVALIIGILSIINITEAGWGKFEGLYVNRIWDRAGIILVDFNTLPPLNTGAGMSFCSETENYCGFKFVITDPNTTKEFLSILLTAKINTLPVTIEWNGCFSYANQNLNSIVSLMLQ